MVARVFRGLPRIFTKAFGEVEPAIWLPRGGTPVVITSYVFNKAYVPMSLDGATLEDAQPTTWIPTASVPGMSNDDRISIGGVSYAVESCRADGRGMSELTLSLRSV